ncbi:Conserved hypothetical protein [Geobacillus thermodenitrificans NG80-2]|uniref:Uncharacterized protein n=3 Tax=Geobacillus TaxID=129337 RepID=O82836_GEOSE|nr:Conserved hypothetical protein [Geobacillus thermodenitrificans NG80-2]BAA31139.1 unnamed protein product [Geobacillus stearothermophilus]
MTIIRFYPFTIIHLSFSFFSLTKPMPATPQRRTIIHCSTSFFSILFIHFSQSSPFVQTSYIIFVRKVTVTTVSYSYDSVKAGKSAGWHSCLTTVLGDEFEKEEGYSMAKPEWTKTTTTIQQTKKEKEPGLGGTLASVFLLGFFIIFAWVSVYFLFLNRI